MSGKGKIKRRAGFTLAETLLAVLILLLVSSIVAMGVPVAKQAFEKVTLAGNAELLLSTAVSTLRDELGTAWDVQAVKASDGGGVIYYSADTGNRSRLYIGVSDDKTNATAIRLHEYSKTTKAEALLDIKKNAQKDRELVYQANDGKALQLICESIALDTTDNTVTITGLCVKDHDGNVTLAQWGGTELEITVFSTKTEEPDNSGSGSTGDSGNGLTAEP